MSDKNNSKPPRRTFQPKYQREICISTDIFGRKRVITRPPRHLKQKLEEAKRKLKESISKLHKLPMTPVPKPPPIVSNIIDLKKYRTAARSDQIETPAIPCRVFRSGQSPENFTFVVVPEHSAEVELEGSSLSYRVRKSQVCGHGAWQRLQASSRALLVSGWEGTLRMKSFRARAAGSFVALGVGRSRTEAPPIRFLKSRIASLPDLANSMTPFT